jgi:hypothetical protein
VHDIAHNHTYPSTQKHTYIDYKALAAQCISSTIRKKETKKPDALIASSLTKYSSACKLTNNTSYYMIDGIFTRVQETIGLNKMILKYGVSDLEG